MTPKIVEVDSASEISEESDQMKEPADNAAGSAEGQGLQFWDSSELCMVRSKEEGKKVYAKMSEGEGGFLLAQFEGDANPVQTEVPNLVLHGAGMVPEKRPGAAKAAAKKAVAKKPAGLLPSDDLEGPNDADPDAAPNDAAPSAAKSVSADPPAFDPLVPLPASTKYSVMYYSNNHTIGIKATVEGKSKQIMSFGGLKVGKTTEDLRSIGHAAVGKLREGQVPEEVGKERSSLRCMCMFCGAC